MPKRNDFASILAKYPNNFPERMFDENELLKNGQLSVHHKQPNTKNQIGSKRHSIYLSGSRVDHTQLFALSCTENEMLFVDFDTSLRAKFM